MRLSGTGQIELARVIDASGLRHIGSNGRFVAGPKQTATCKRCGAVYEPKHAGRISFCSRDCSFAYRRENRKYESKAEAVRAKKNRERTRLGRPPLGTVYDLVCRVCSTGFRSPQPRVVYCSPECRDVDGQQKAGLAAGPRPLCECRECGERFVPLYGDKRRVFCSGRCAKAEDLRIRHAARRAKEAGVEIVDAVDPMLVFKRDGWRCYLCGVETPQDLRGTTDPNAPELDHIEPIAEGGEHSYANVACCCRSCNWSKGAALPKAEGYRYPDLACL